MDLIKKTFEWEMNELETDYVDFAFLHCIDDLDDYEEVINNGIYDYLLNLKEKEIVRL